MTTRVGRGRKLFSLAFLLLQLLLPPAAALADAREVRGAPVASAHFESKSSDSCARGHSDDCVLCQFLSHVPVPPARAFVFAASSQRVQRAPQYLRVASPVDPSSASLPRAPPQS